MTSNITFHNPGEIDIRGATIAGLSAKDTSSPIGQFGTGLKYSIACILRWGGTIAISSGTDLYSFHAEDLEFRGAGFKQIMISCNESTPTPLGFTTEYGKNWEPWMVFRELLSNARDEGGSVTLEHVSPLAGTTTIVVTCPRLEAPYHNRNQIILPDDQPYAYTHENVSIARGKREYIYYRSVRVANNVTWPFLFNIHTGVELTEDRTVSSFWSVNSKIGEAIQSCTDATLIRELLTFQYLGDKGISYLNPTYSAYNESSQTFRAVVESLYRKHGQPFQQLAMLLFADSKPEVFHRPAATLTAIQSAMLAKAMATLARMDIDTSAAPITVCDLPAGIMGQYNTQLNHIYLSPECFQRGTKYVVSTLYEEFIHCITGKADCNYDMQTYLFDKIVSLYEEHVIGEPI